MKIITNGKVFYRGAFHNGLEVAYDGAQIRAVGTDLYFPDAERLDAQGMYVLPGFVDIHIHALLGHDTMDGRDGVAAMAKALPGYGVTAFCPTTMSAPFDETSAVLESVLDDPVTEGAAVLGFHMEGPFLNVARKGAMRPECLIDASAENFEKLVGRAGALIRQMTVAPDAVGALTLASYLAARGITVSVGHTEASYDLVEKAIDAGFTHMTHLFNAMTPLHHREPGPIGAGLSDERICAELIADTIHLHPAILKAAVRCKGADKICLISDSMSAAGMPDGIYALGGQRVTVKDGVARIDAGNLAGSTLTLDTAVRNMILIAGVSPEEAITMASGTPARESRAYDRGRLDAGCIADILLMDKDWTLRRTILRGADVFVR